MPSGPKTALAALPGAVLAAFQSCGVWDHEAACPRLSALSREMEQCSGEGISCGGFGGGSQRKGEWTGCQGAWTSVTSSVVGQPYVLTSYETSNDSSLQLANNNKNKISTELKTRTQD